MISRLTRSRHQEWRVIQARMIGETEAFLEEGLRHPEYAVVIPSIPVGMGEFRRGWANEFWSRVLGTS